MACSTRLPCTSARLILILARLAALLLSSKPDGCFRCGDARDDGVCDRLRAASGMVELHGESRAASEKGGRMFAGHATDEQETKKLSWAERSRSLERPSQAVTNKVNKSNASQLSRGRLCRRPRAPKSRAIGSG